MLTARNIGHPELADWQKFLDWDKFDKAKEKLLKELNDGKINTQ